MAELNNTLDKISPQSDWTIEQWDEWANNLPEGKLKTDYFNKKRDGLVFEYFDMTGPSITVDFKPIAKTEVQLGAEKLEEQTKEEKKEESDFQAKADAINQQSGKTDLEIARERAQLRLQTISDNYNKEQTEKIIAPATLVYKSYIEEIDDIFDQVYNPNKRQELREKAITGVEKTTISSGVVGFGGFGGMSMRPSNVVTTKSFPYTRFEEKAKTKVKKDFLLETGESWNGNITEDVWKPIAIELYIKDSQANELESLVGDKMEYLEDEFDNWYFRGSPQYMKDVANYKVARNALDKYYEEKKNKAGKLIETAGLKANTVGTVIQNNSDQLRTKRTDLNKLEQYTTDNSLKYEEASVEWNNFLKENPNTTNYSEQQQKKFNELQNNLATAENNLNTGVEIFNTARREYNQLLDETKGYVRTYGILKERLNTIIEESHIDSYAQIADIVGRSYDNTDVFLSKAAATTLTLAANIAELDRVGTEKVLDMFGMDAENAEVVSKLLIGGDATTFFIDKTKEISEDLRGSVRKNISAKEINSLGSLTNFMIDLFAEQSINTAITATLGPAGLVLVSAGAAGGKVSDMKGEEFVNVLNKETGKYEKQRRKTFNPKTGEYEEVRYDPWQYLLSGTIAFGAEYLTETVSLSQFRSATNVFKKGGKIAPNGTDFNLRGTKYSNTEFTIGGALFRYGKNVNKEGFAELAAEGFNNMGDKFILGKDISLTQGLSEAYLSGAMMSGLGFQIPVVVSEVRKSFAGDAEVKAFNKNGLRIKRLTDRINELMSIQGPITQDKLDAMESLNKERDVLLAENHKILGVNNQRMNDMDNVDKRRVLDINNKKYEIRSEIDKINSNNTLTTAEKNNAIARKKKEIDLLDNVKLRIISNATLNADIIRENKLENQKLIESGLGEKLISVEGSTEADAKESAIKAIEETEIDDTFLENYIKGKDITKEQATKELKKTAISNIKEQFSKMEEGTVSGFHTGVEFGIPMSITIENNASNINPTVKSHERGHHGLFRKLIDGDADAFGLIDDLESYVKKRYKGAYKVFQEAKETYEEEEGYTKLDKYEEKLAFLTDFLRKKNIKSDLSLRGKLLSRVDKIRNKSKTAELSEIRTGEDMFNLLLSFTSSYEQGEMSGLAAKVLKGEVGVKATTKTKGKISKNKKSKSNIHELAKEYDMSKASGKSRFISENLTITPQGKETFNFVDSKFGREALPIVESITKRLYDKVPADLKRGIDRNDFRNDLVSMAATLIQNEYDPSKQDLDKFISNRLNLRANKLATDTFGQDFTEDVSEAKTLVAEDVVETTETKLTQQIKLKERLGDDAIKITEEVKARSKDIDLEKVNFKTLKDLTPELTQEMFGVVPKPGNLTKADVRNAQQFIAKNWEILLAMLPEGSTPSGTATGIQKVLLNAFYTKGERVKAAKTGSRAGLQEQTKRNNITKEQFLEVFGVTPAKEANIIDRNTSSRIKAIIDQTGRMLTNQAVREHTIEKGETVPSKVWEGKSKVMFSVKKKEKTFTKDGVTVHDEFAAINEDGLKMLKELQKSWVDKNGKVIPRKNYMKWDDFNAKIRKKLSEWKGDKMKNIPDNSIYEVYASINFLNQHPQLKLVDKLTKGPDNVGGGDLVVEDISSGKKLNIEIKMDPEADFGATGVDVIWGNDEGKRFKKKDKSTSPLTVSELNAIEKTVLTINPKLYSDILELNKKLGRNILEEKLSLEDLDVIKERYLGRLDLLSEMRDGKVKNHTLLDNAAQIIQHYLGKGTDYIWIGGKGLYHFGKDVANLGTTKFNAKQKLRLRFKARHLPPKVSFIDNNGKKVTINSKKYAKLDSEQKQQLRNKKGVEWEKLGYKIAITNSIEPKSLSDGKIVKFSKAKQKIIDKNSAIIKGSKVKLSKAVTPEESLRELAILDKALQIARDPNAPAKGISVLDFDDTLAITKSNVLYTMPDGKTGKITPAEFAKKGKEMEAEGAVWDFSEFNKVVDGKTAPLFQKALKLQKKFGSDNMFILTARAPESAKAIHKFIKANGLNIPLKNITGLADSSPLAKSGWVVNKAAEGYNDFYFADDHMANVNAVKKVLDVIDVKSKVQQAKIKFSKSVNKQFNDIIANKTGIEWFKKYQHTRAKLMGEKKGRFKFFVPPSADDFVGLLYHMLGKGAKGDAQMAWFKEHLLDPYARAMHNLSRDRIQMMNDFKALKKGLKDIPKNLKKEAIDGFTYENVIRIHIWNKQEESIEGLFKKDITKIESFVRKNPELRKFADQLINITKESGYSTPTYDWLSGTITTDLMSVLDNTKRELYLKEWERNIGLIFSPKNMNKLEAAFGSKYREAMQNMITRMRTGRNRSTISSDRLVNRFMDYINNSVGTVMFFNMRSALLQGISSINFINWSDNNIAAAGKAFANQPQYWKDFMYIMNSDFLVDRRNGLKINVSESEIADAAANSSNKAKGAISWLLTKGFLPTQFMDSFAIASGGATFYRNRVNKYLKEGLGQKEAESKAFDDFREIAEESQQSSRPDRISQQQAGGLGRIVLAFANTPMQYTRLIKKASLDLINGRGDWKSNISRIVYYGAIQNVIFNALQQAIFALSWGDDDDDDDEEAIAARDEKVYSIANSMLDSILRGTGIAGGVVSVVKNISLEIYERSGKKRPEYAKAALRILDISPPVDIKVSKLMQAANNFEYNKDIIHNKGFSIDNPAWLSLGLVVSATTNIPLDRLVTKSNNVRFALNSENETWKRLASVVGYPEWQLRSHAENVIFKEERKKEKAAYRSLKKWEVIDGDEIKELKKSEQINILKELKLSDEEIKGLNKEESRVAKILEIYNKNPKEVKKVLDKKGRDKKLTKDEIVNNQIYKLTKGEQEEAMRKLGVEDSLIKEAKSEASRVEILKGMYTNDENKKIIDNAKGYKPPPLTKREVRYKEIKALLKQQQIDSLRKYGLTKDEVKVFVTEDDRVEMILDLQDKEQK